MPPPTTLRGSARLSKIFAATATSPPNSTQNFKDVATRRRSCPPRCLCQFQGFLRDRGPYHFLQLFGVFAKKSFRGVWRGQANPTAPRHAHWPSVSKIPTPTTGSTTTPCDLKNGTPKILESGARANRCPIVANRGGGLGKNPAQHQHQAGNHYLSHARPQNSVSRRCKASPAPPFATNHPVGFKNSRQAE